jgi:hypothetical protein
MSTEIAIGKIPDDCPPDGTFLMNTDHMYVSRWPIRFGDPQATKEHTVESLKKMGLFGAYVDYRWLKKEVENAKQAG